jgi:hypothetical protein
MGSSLALVAVTFSTFDATKTNSLSFRERYLGAAMDGMFEISRDID